MTIKVYLLFVVFHRAPVSFHSVPMQNHVSVLSVCICTPKMWMREWFNYSLIMPQHLALILPLSFSFLPLLPPLSILQTLLFPFLMRCIKMDRLLYNHPHILLPLHFKALSSLAIPIVYADCLRLHILQASTPQYPDRTP